MCGGAPKDTTAADMRAAEAARQAKIQTGMSSINKTFNQFNDAFYQNRFNDYINFAMPQFNQQFSDSNRALTFALARQGIDQSSEGARRFGKLINEANISRQGVVDQAYAAENQARKAVEDARSGLVADLYASANPTAAASASVHRAAYLAQPQGYSPIGQLFSNVTAGLNSYRQAYDDQMAYNNAVNQYGLNIGGFGGGSGRNVNG